MRTIFVGPLLIAALFAGSRALAAGQGDAAPDVAVTPSPPDAAPPVYETAGGRWVTSFGMATAVVRPDVVRFTLDDGSTIVDIGLVHFLPQGSYAITGAFAAPKADQSANRILAALPRCDTPLDGSAFHGSITGEPVSDRRGNIVAINGYYGTCFDGAVEDAAHQFNARRAP